MTYYSFWEDGDETTYHTFVTSAMMNRTVSLSLSFVLAKSPLHICLAVFINTSMIVGCGFSLCIIKYGFILSMRKRYDL